MARKKREAAVRWDSEEEHKPSTDDHDESKKKNVSVKLRRLAMLACLAMSDNFLSLLPDDL